MRIIGSFVKILSIYLNYSRILKQLRQRRKNGTCPKPDINLKSAAALISDHTQTCTRVSACDSIVQVFHFGQIFVKTKAVGSGIIESLLSLKTQLKPMNLNLLQTLNQLFCKALTKHFHIGTIQQIIFLYRNINP